MAFAPDGRRVVPPKWGTTGKNGEYGAPANRAEVPTHSAGRRAPPCVTKDGQPLGAGGQAALPPHLGRPPTLPRPGDPGAAGNPVRAIGGRPAARHVFLGTPDACNPWRRRRRGRRRPQRTHTIKVADRPGDPGYLADLGLPGVAWRPWLFSRFGPVLPGWASPVILALFPRRSPCCSSGRWCRAEAPQLPSDPLASLPRQAEVVRPTSPLSRLPRE